MPHCEGKRVEDRHRDDDCGAKARQGLPAQRPLTSSAPHTNYRLTARRIGESSFSAGRGEAGNMKGSLVKKKEGKDADFQVVRLPLPPVWSLVTTTHRLPIS